VIVLALQILAAYVLIDALSGIYHLATDKGFNIRSQIAMFQWHHDTNTMDNFDWQTFAVGLPVAAVGAWFHSPFWIACGVFAALTQVTHYYAHCRSEFPIIHRIVRGLQRARLIVHPASHSRHHREPFARDFCLLSGWNNSWLNGVLWICGA
jgi:hypothetical protein